MSRSDKRVWEAVDGHPGISKACSERGEKYRINRTVYPGHVNFESSFASLEGAVRANRKCVPHATRVLRFVLLMSTRPLL
jgi:hypothetical protein